MSEWKEVWHVWEEDFDKLSLIRRFLLSGGGVVFHGYDEDCYPSAAVAYTTGQKRRRVECGLCSGSGFNDDVFNELGVESDCVVCSGRGYKWEYKKDSEYPILEGDS